MLELTADCVPRSRDCASKGLYPLWSQEGMIILLCPRSLSDWQSRH